MTLPLSAPTPGRARLDIDKRSSSRTSAADRARANDERVFASLFLEHYASLCEFVDSYVRAWEKPSDHVPVWADLDLEVA